MLRKLKLKKNYIKHKIPLLGILCFFAVYVAIQKVWADRRLNTDLEHAGLLNYLQNEETSSQQNITPPSNKKMIKLLWASQQVKRKGAPYDVLIDSVQLEHEGAILYCDSAYWNPNNNSFEAFGDVVMNQGDSVYLYGDYMQYDGNTQIVKVRYNVKLEHLSGTLFTDSLNYDRLDNVGYYLEGGTLIDTVNTLTSLYGNYRPNLNLATFMQEVELDNPDYKLYSDTLIYNTQTRIANIVSQTKIVSDSGTIHGNRGSFNTLTQLAILLDQSTVENKQGYRILRGDSIIYKKGVNNGEVFGHMFLQDTIQKIILRGNRGYYNGETDYAYATDSAELITYAEGDSLFLHADILEMFRFSPREVKKIQQRLSGDSIIHDTVSVIESAYRMKAYHHVRFYKTDIQGVCDSLVFNSTDSLLRMYKEPILWSDNRQLTGDSILILLNDSTINRMYVLGSAFSVEEKDSIHYNQLKSRELTTYFENGKVKRIFAEGNVETITYPEDKYGKLNRIQNFLICSFLDVNMQDGAFERLKAWPTPSGTTTPFALLTNDMLRLTNFRWYNYVRPTDRTDIFRTVIIKEDDKRPVKVVIPDEDEYEN